MNYVFISNMFNKSVKIINFVYYLLDLIAYTYNC